VDERLVSINEIGFRLDARSISKDLLSRICTLVKNLGCVLLTPEYEVLVPDESMVFEAIARSNARRFVEDPTSTLLNVKTKSHDARINRLINPSKNWDT
jgi:hypothetical protein